MSRTETQAILDQVLQEVAGLGNAERRRVLIALRKAEEELAGALAAWLKDKPDGADRFTARHYRQGLAQIKGTRAVFDDVGTTLHGSLNQAGKTATIMSHAHIKKEWEHFSMLFEGEVKQLPIAIAGKLTTVQKTLLHRYRKISGTYTRETRKWLSKQLAVGVLKNETFDQMTTRLVRLAGPKGLIHGAPDAVQMARGLLHYPRARMSRIVRTEVMNAYNAGHMESIAALAKGDPDVMKRWDSSLDRRGCPVCRDLDGEVQKPLDKFSSGDMRPPQHPHCFIPSTKAQGVFEAGLKIKYSGQVVELTMDSGSTLTVTPNHPVFTGDAWVPAGELVENVDLFRYVGKTKNAPCETFDVEHPPARIDQVFNFFEVSGLSAHCSPSKGDLHGDAVNGIGDIHIVYPKGELENIVPASPSNVAFGLGAEVNAAISYYASDGRSANPEFLSDLTYRFPGHVVRDKLVEIRRYEFSGHVYDLQSVNGWLFANNYITKNCRCTSVAWKKDWKHPSLPSEGTETINPAISPVKTSA